MILSTLIETDKSTALPNDFVVLVEYMLGASKAGC